MFIYVYVNASKFEEYDTGLFVISIFFPILQVLITDMSAILLLNANNDPPIEWANPFKSVNSQH